MLAKVIYFSKSIEVTFDKVWFNARTKYCFTNCNVSEFRRASRTPPPPPQEDDCLYTCHLPVTMHHYDQQNSDVNSNKLTKASWSGLLYSPCVA